MNRDSYRIVVPGKWILSGEHSVLRGQPAIALPHSQYQLVLEFEARESGAGPEIHPRSIAGVVEPLLKLLEKRWGNPNPSSLAGVLHLDSSIPLRAGFGSSAAFCYALTTWYADRCGKPTGSESLWELASRLEDHFHGRSSGLDVAVVASQAPILYRRGETPRKLDLTALPRFTFHDTGVRASTQECIAKVEEFITRNAELATLYDEKMGACSSTAHRALLDFSSDPKERPNAVRELARAMNQAQECFYAWDLVPNDVKRLEAQLREQGALGVKLTGAGGGGFLVALWPE